jgi:plastocyanin
MFAVQLVNNDHTPLDPPIKDSITVMVTAVDTPKTVNRVTLDLVADNISFNMSEIRVPAGVEVTIEFKNMENVRHNFALYETSRAKNPIFIGEIIIGPQDIEYKFVAPEESGTYFFRCDVHPTSMTGRFVVTPN